VVSLGSRVLFDSVGGASVRELKVAAREWVTDRMQTYDITSLTKSLVTCPYITVPPGSLNQPECAAFGTLYLDR